MRPEILLFAFVLSPSDAYSTRRASAVAAYAAWSSSDDQSSSDSRPCHPVRSASSAFVRSALANRPISTPLPFAPARDEPTARVSASSDNFRSSVCRVTVARMDAHGTDPRRPSRTPIARLRSNAGPRSARACSAEAGSLGSRRARSRAARRFRCAERCRRRSRAHSPHRHTRLDGSDRWRPPEVVGVRWRLTAGARRETVARAVAAAGHRRTSRSTMLLCAAPPSAFLNRVRWFDSGRGHPHSRATAWVARAARYACGASERQRAAVRDRCSGTASDAAPGQSLQAAAAKGVVATRLRCCCSGRDRACRR